MKTESGEGNMSFRRMSFRQRKIMKALGEGRPVDENLWQNVWLLKRLLGEFKEN